MNSVAKLWYRENDPDDEVDLLILQQRDCYVASVDETGDDKLVMTNQCVKNPEHISQMMNVDGTTSMTLVANCSTTHSSRKQETEEISVIREVGVWEVVDRPRDEVVFDTHWVDINKGDESKPFYRSRLVVQEYKRQADWSFFTAIPRSLSICATIDELPNEVGQPVA